MTLIGNRYLKDTEPTGADGTIAYGYQWLNSSNGNLYERNSSNTAWVLIGNVNNANLGLLPLAGGTMTGAINGSTGWAPLASPALTGSPTKNGLEIATIDDVNGTTTNIYDTVQSKITEAISSTTTAINVKSKIAMASGVFDFTSGFGTSDSAHPNPPQTIPLPYYPSGEQAVEADCVWFASPNSIASDVSAPDILFSNGLASGWSGVSSNIVDPTKVRTFTVTQYNGTRSYATKVAWFIIAVKP